VAARILIAEDNPANPQLMTYLLKSFAHVPLVARDGEEALELVRTGPLDLIICDMQLPRIDGYSPRCARFFVTNETETWRRFWSVSLSTRSS
jgi:CheY-like chemotaxis protein